MGTEHRTTCWMSPLIKGTDAERAELRQKITSAIRSCHGNLERSAEMLGVNIATLRRYVDRLGLGGLVEQQRGTLGAQVARTRMRRAVGALGGRPRKSP